MTRFQKIATVAQIALQALGILTVAGAIAVAVGWASTPRGGQGLAKPSPHDNRAVAREGLLAFVRQVQSETGGKGPNGRNLVTVANHLAAADIPGASSPSLQFGYGYFPREKVVFDDGPGGPRVMETGDAVDAFLDACGVGR